MGIRIIRKGKSYRRWWYGEYREGGKLCRINDFMESRQQKGNAEGLLENLIKSILQHLLV